jgi:hypothetical protein
MYISQQNGMLPKIVVYRTGKTADKINHTGEMKKHKSNFVWKGAEQWKVR